MKLENPYAIFTEKERKSIKYKWIDFMVRIECLFINRKIERK